MEKLMKLDKILTLDKLLNHIGTDLGFSFTNFGYGYVNQFGLGLQNAGAYYFSISKGNTDSYPWDKYIDQQHLLNP